MTWCRLRAALNLVNLSTPTGLLVAVLSRCTLTRGPRGLLIATGYRLRVPANPAFTVGNVVLTRRGPGFLEARPRLLAHEERHSSQYAACLGLPFLPLYAAGAGWSLLRCGNVAAHNPFERLAGLADGGYADVPPRPLWERRLTPRLRKLQPFSERPTHPQRAGSTAP